MTRTVSHLVTVVLLVAMIAAGAGAMCRLPASSAHSSSAGCHPVRVPSNPQPADYRCCMSRHPSALLTNIVSQRPALHSLMADAIQALALTRQSATFPPASPRSGGPPGVLILRI